MRITEKGFTVIELMITLTIVVILATVAVPSLSSILKNNRIAGAAEKIKADMEWARTTAIRDNKPIKMVITASGSGNWCYGFDDLAKTPNCDCTLKDTTATACTVDNINRQNDQDAYGDTTLNTTIPGNDLVFQSRGRSDDTGTFTLQIDSKIVTININALGRSNIVF